MEVNIETGAMTEYEDAQVVYVPPIAVILPTIADLMAKLADIQIEVNALNKK